MFLFLFQLFHFRGIISSIVCSTIICYMITKPIDILLGPLFCSIIIITIIITVVIEKVPEKLRR